MTPLEQSIRDKAAYQVKVQGRGEAERQRAKRKKLLTSLVFCLIAGSSVLAIARTFRIDEVKREAVMTQYAKWTAYRDANCKVTDKLYGVTLSYGKFSAKHNLITYDCGTGIRYTLSESAEKAILSGRGDIEDIPVIK